MRVTVRQSRPDAVALTGGAVVLALLVVDIVVEGFVVAHLVAVLAAAAFLVLLIILRRRYEEALRAERAARARSDFAARTGPLLEALPDPEEMLARVVRVAVPDMADMCVVDLYEDGEVVTSVAHAADPERSRAQQEIRDRWPPSERHPAPTVARTGRPLLLDAIPPERLREFADDEEHYRLTLAMRHESAVLVPLIARGRTLGVMTLSRFEGSETYGASDVELAEEIARRAALALDNARLFGELQRTEAQLEAVLGNLADAVTVLRPPGELVYLNDAAVRLVGGDKGDEFTARSLRDRFLWLDEHGHPVPLERMPGQRALAGEDFESMLMRIVSRATGEQRWVLIKATAVRDERSEVVLAVAIIEDVTDARMAERQQTFLAEASRLLSASLDLGATFERTAQVVVPEIADWCCVDVRDERGAVRRVAAVGEQERAPDPADNAGVLTDGTPVLPEGEGALLAVPMTAGDRIVGRITMGTRDSGRRLEGAELALALELGARAGIAMENARVHAARSHIATTLQRSLLPPRLPVIPGLTIAARFRAAGDTTEVGGDFYDLFSAGDGWMVVIGDVTGKGPEAAATTSLARFTMRTAAVYERSPADVLARLNATLAADPERRQICTAVCARIDPAGDDGVRLRIACGGHPPPLLLGDGPVREAGIPGSLLGAFDSGSWSEEELVLGEGQSLVLFTDGVTDARGEAAERFGNDRLVATLAGADGLEADAVAGAVDAALNEFERGQQRDDVALLVLRAGPGDSSLVAASGDVRSLRDSRAADG